MSLLRRNRFSSLPSVFDDIFDRDFGDGGNFSSERSSLPSVNIRETEDEFKLEVAAPGMKKDDFNIAIKENILSISSEKKEENKEEEDKYTRREFSYHSFRRTFTLPNSIDENKIEASYKDGILELKIPKREEARKKEPRQINIK